LSIVSSVIDSQTVQVDGRKSVHETHTDQIGAKYAHSWLAPGNADLNAALAAYATQLGLDITAAEIASNVASVLALGSLASPVLVYSTAAANFAALRVAYQTATQFQAVMIGDFLNTLTSNQLQNAFGLTAGQVTTLQTNKLQPAATLASSIRATVGQ
jgi:hypothetical protein